MKPVLMEGTFDEALNLYHVRNKFGTRIVAIVRMKDGGLVFLQGWLNECLRHPIKVLGESKNTMNRCERPIPVGVAFVQR